MLKVIDNYKRKALNEGRNYQMGFAFCSPPKKEVVETVQALTACKDYLNDIVFTESTKTKMSAYGLKTSFKGIFEGTDKAYLAISILPHQNGGDYGSMERDTERLRNNYKTLNEFMNYFCEKLNTAPCSIEATENANVFLVTFDKSWAKYTYAISLFGLLLRVGQFYTKGDPLTFVKEFSLFAPDVYLVKAVLPKIEKLISNGGLIEQDLSVLEPGEDVHNLGIQGYNL